MSFEHIIGGLMFGSFIFVQHCEIVYVESIYGIFCVLMSCVDSVRFLQIVFEFSISRPNLCSLIGLGIVFLAVHFPITLSFVCFFV